MSWNDHSKKGTGKPKGKFISKKVRYASTPKPCAICHNPSGQLIDIDSQGNPLPFSDQYEEFPSRKLGKRALAKIIKNLPPKKHPSDPPLYSVQNVK